MIVFTGTGRSGTLWLAKCFHARHEYKMGLFFVSQWPEFKNDWSEFEDRLSAMQRHLRNVDITSFRDSSNMYVHFLDALYEMDNNIKIVLCIRNLENFIRSAIKKRWHTKKYQGYHHRPVNGWDNWEDRRKMEWLFNFRNGKALARMSRVPKENKMICHLEEVSKDISPIENFLGIKADEKYASIIVNRGKR